MGDTKFCYQLSIAMTKFVIIFFFTVKTKDPPRLSFQVLGLFGTTSCTLDCPITCCAINAESGLQIDNWIREFCYSDDYGRNFTSCILWLHRKVCDTVEPPLSGHPRGTGKWPLPGVWQPNRGLL